MLIPTFNCNPHLTNIKLARKKQTVYSLTSATVNKGLICNHSICNYTVSANSNKNREFVNKRVQGPQFNKERDVPFFLCLFASIQISLSWDRKNENAYFPSYESFRKSFVNLR